MIGKPEAFFEGEAEGHVQEDAVSPLAFSAVSFQPAQAVTSVAFGYPNGSGLADELPPLPQSSNPQATKATRATQSVQATQATKATQASGRKRIIIALIIAILVVDIVLLAIWVTTRGATGQAVVGEPLTVVSSQLGNNHGSAIYQIGYDPALSFSTYGSAITSIDATTLKPLENNYLATSGSGSSAVTVLVDETAFGRVIAMNADWVAYLNRADNTVLSDVWSGTTAEQYLQQYPAGTQIAFHRLALGEINVVGKYVYVLAEANYTLLYNGQSNAVDSVFLYKLAPQGDSLAVSNIEQLAAPPPSATPPPSSTVGGG